MIVRSREVPNDRKTADMRKLQIFGRKGQEVGTCEVPERVRYGWSDGGDAEGTQKVLEVQRERARRRGIPKQKSRRLRMRNAMVKFIARLITFFLFLVVVYAVAKYPDMVAGVLETLFASMTKIIGGLVNKIFQYIQLRRG
jgi:hypothetical protein